MQKERLFWIDFLKCIAIFLVILGHVSKPGLREYEVIYSFHMPLFFLISGYLTSINLPFWEHLKKQVRTLIVPTWILSFIAMPLDIARMYSHPDLYPVGEYIINFVTCNLYWFIPVLFLMKVVFYPLMRNNNYIMIQIVCVISMIIGYSFGDIENQSSLINNTLSRFRFIPFYLIGYCLRGYIQIDRLSKIKLTMATILTGVFVISYMLFGSGEMNRLTTIGNVILFYLQASLAILSLYLFVRCINQDKLKKSIRDSVVKISESTLLIYVLHFIPVIIFRQFFDISRMGGGNRVVIETIVALSILSVFIPLSNIVLNKYPWLIGKRK